MQTSAAGLHAQGPAVASWRCCRAAAAHSCELLCELLAAAGPSSAARTVVRGVPSEGSGHSANSSPDMRTAEAAVKRRVEGSLGNKQEQRASDRRRMLPAAPVTACLLRVCACAPLLLTAVFVQRAHKAAVARRRHLDFDLLRSVRARQARAQHASPCEQLLCSCRATTAAAAAAAQLQLLLLPPHNEPIQPRAHRQPLVRVPRLCSVPVRRGGRQRGIHVCFMR